MRRHLQVLLVVLLTGGLIAFFLRNANLAQVWEATRRARWELIALAIAMTAVSYTIRIERWRRLLGTIGGASFRTVGRATVMGFAANALMPGRVGEALRPYLVAKREGLSMSAAVGTIVLERLLDLVAIVIGVASFLVVFDTPTRDPELLGVVRVGAMTTAIAAVAGWAVIIALARQPEAVDRLARRVAYAAPGGLVRGITAVIQRFLQGLELVRRPGQLVVATVLSLALWAFIAASIWATSVAFGIDISFGGSVILTGLTALGVAVPTPAGVGGFHAAFELGATALYGAGPDEAVGAALVTHLIAFGPITLLGLLFMMQEGLRLSGLSALRRQQTPASTTPESGELGASAVKVVQSLESEDQGGTR